MKFKKALSVILSFVFVFGMFSFAASATEVIYDASILMDFDIEGLIATDYEEYIIINTAGLEFEDNYDDPAVYVYDSNDESFNGEFADGETYTFLVYLSALEGFELNDEMNAWLNGESVECYVDYWTPDNTEVYYVEIEFEVTVGESVVVPGRVNSLSIDVNIKDGTKVGDYTEYVEINTDGITYDDNNQYKCVFAYVDGSELTYDDYFRAGTVYELYLDFTYEDGYWFGTDFDSVTVNGEEVTDYYIGYYYNESDEIVHYAEIIIEIEPEEELNFIQRIIKFFTDLFEKIVDFFTFDKRL